MTDVIDNLILEILRQDSRIPISQLAQKVGRSRTAVQERISKLEKSGRILGYSILEPSKLDIDSFSAIIFVTLEVRSKSENFLKKVKSLPQISSCTWIIGDHDFALTIKPIDKPSLQALLQTLFMIPGVKQTETIMTVHREF